MTTAIEAPPAAPVGAAGPRPPGERPPTWRERVRRWRLPALLAGLAVTAAVVAGIATTGPTTGPALDPHSTTPTGTHALAALLAGRGVRLEQVPAVADAVRAAARQPVTVVVPRPELIDGLGGLAALPPGSRLLLVAPPDTATAALAPGVRRMAAVATGVRPPSCALPVAAVAGPAVTGGDRYTAPPGGTGCYPVGGRPTLVSTSRQGVDVTLLGAGSLLTNARLADEGDAALALGLTAARPVVVWLQPRPGQSSVADGQGPGLLDLLPDRLVLALGQLAIAVLVVAIWRGRRLGPTVPEPLPVTVRSAESVEGTARLYTAARARDRAAAHLRAGTIGRLRAALGLAPDAQPGAVVAAVSARTARPADDIRKVLYGAAPATDQALVRLADDLDAVEAGLRDA